MTLADALRYVRHYLAPISPLYAILSSLVVSASHFVILVYDLLPTSRLRTFHIVETTPRCWEMKEEGQG